MFRRLFNVKASLFVFVIAAFAMAALACGSQPAAAPAPAPAPAQPAIDPAELSKLVQDAVKQSVPSQQSGPAPVSAQEIQSMVEAAVTAAAPEGASAEEISAMVRQAVEASSQPGASKEDIEELVTNAVNSAAPAQSGVSADEVQKIVSEAVKAIPEKIVVQEVVLQPIAAPAESLEEGKVGIFNRPPEADPKRGGVVRTGWPIAVQHFDLHQGAIAYGGMTMMYNNLVYWNAADGERTIIPDLAESWDISPDGLTWTFPLRQGVQWHDGMDFTSADVEATFDRIFNPPEGVVTGQMKDLFESVESVEATGTHEIQISLKRVTPWFLELLAADPLFGPAVIYPKHVIDAENGDLRRALAVGTGPFTVKDRQPGETWELEANPNYWDPELPYVDGVKQFHIPAWPDRGTAVLTGQTDFAWNGSVETWQEAAKRPDKFQVGLPSSTAIWTVFLNNEVPPFDDKRVRRAIHLAVDKWKMSEVITSVVIPFPVSHWQAPTSPYAWTEERWSQLPGYRRDNTEDIAAAKQLMAEAGYADGFEIQNIIVSNPTPYTEVVGPAFLAQLKETLNITAKDFKVIERALEGDTLSSGDWDLFIGPSGWGNPTTDPTTMWVPYASCDGARNFMNYCNPDLDPVLDQLMVELDPAKRQELADQVVTMLDEDPPTWMVGTATGVPMGWNYVKGLSIPTRVNGGWKRFETVWLDK